MNDSETQFIRQTYQLPYPPAALKSVEDAKGDSYNAFVWELATKFTNSPEEAEAAVQEMFIDIQRCDSISVKEQPIKHHLTALVALRRLIRFLQ